jgi:hypothetical protein
VLTGRADARVLKSPPVDLALRDALPQLEIRILEERARVRQPIIVTDLALSKPGRDVALTWRTR